MKALQADCKQLRKLIKNYAQAVEKRSWMGSYPPEQHKLIKKELQVAKIKLYGLIRKMEDPAYGNVQ